MQTMLLEENKHRRIHPSWGQNFDQPEVTTSG